jgi:hypothetical protein
MLFPSSRSSRPEAPVSIKGFSVQPDSPLCDLRDLCAMLSPERAGPEK